MRCFNTICNVNSIIVSPVREIRSLGSNEGRVWATGSPTHYPDNKYTQLIEKSLQKLYIDNNADSVSLETLPCTIKKTYGNSTTVIREAGKTGLSIGNKTNADIVIWGDNFELENEIELFISAPQYASREKYYADYVSINKKLGKEIDALIVGSIISNVEYFSNKLSGNFIYNSTQEKSTYLPQIKQIMERVERLIINPPEDMTNGQFGNLYSVAGFLLSRQYFLNKGYYSSIEKDVSDYYITAAEYYANNNWRKGFVFTELANFHWNRGALNRCTECFKKSKEYFKKALIYYNKYKTKKLETIAKIAETNAALFELDKSQISLGEKALFDLKHVTNTDLYSKDSTEYASLLTHLGIVTQRLGKHSKDKLLLCESANYFRKAQDIDTKERNPDSWASIQNNLGNSLSNLGILEESVAHEKAAVSAFKSALTVRTLDKNILFWAKTRYSLALHYLRQGGQFYWNGSQMMDVDSENIDKAHKIFKETINTINQMVGTVQQQTPLGNILKDLKIGLASSNPRRFKIRVITVPG